MPTHKFGEDDKRWLEDSIPKLATIIFIVVVVVLRDYSIFAFYLTTFSKATGWPMRICIFQWSTNHALLPEDVLWYLLMEGKYGLPYALSFSLSNHLFIHDEDCL